MNVETCAWIGEGEGCAEPTVPGHSYCSVHLHRVYQAGSALRRRHRERSVANTVWDLEQLFQEAVEELESEGYDFGMDRW